MRVGPGSLKTPEPSWARQPHRRWPEYPPGRRSPNRGEADRREVRARRRRKCHSSANCGRSPHLLPHEGRAAAVRIWPGALFFGEASWPSHRRFGI